MYVRKYEKVYVCERERMREHVLKRECDNVYVCVCGRESEHDNACMCVKMCVRE